LKFKNVAPSEDCVVCITFFNCHDKKIDCRFELNGKNVKLSRTLFNPEAERFVEKFILALLSG